MEEPKDFLSLIRIVPDPRILGMVTYPLGEILLVALVGTLCRMEDWDEIVYFAEEQLEWLRRFLPFKDGIASAKTFRTVFRALEHKVFSEAFSAWVADWGGRRHRHRRPCAAPRTARRARRGMFSMPLPMRAAWFWARNRLTERATRSRRF